jgi:hypothetical protein
VWPPSSEPKSKLSKKSAISRWLSASAPKTGNMFVRPHGVKTQKFVVIIVTAVNASNWQFWYKHTKFRVLLHAARNGGWRTRNLHLAFTLSIKNMRSHKCKVFLLLHDLSLSVLLTSHWQMERRLMKTGNPGVLQKTTAICSSLSGSTEYFIPAWKQVPFLTKGLYLDKFISFHGLNDTFHLQSRVTCSLSFLYRLLSKNGATASGLIVGHVS